MQNVILNDFSLSLMHSFDFVIHEMDFVICIHSTTIMQVIVDTINSYMAGADHLGTYSIHVMVSTFLLAKSI